MSGVETSNMLKQEGFIRLELVNEETGHRQVIQENAVTVIGKQAMLAMGGNVLLNQPSGIGRGTKYLDSPFGKISSNGYFQIDDIDKALHAYLINTTDVLTVDTKLIPVYNADFTRNDAKIIGEGTFRRTVTTAKEGILDQTKGSYLVDDMVVAQRWKFDLAQANGTFNKICIGAGVSTDRFNGFYIAKGIDPSDALAAGGRNPISRYFRPGLTGITNANEILLCTDGTNKATHILNLDTGDQTLLDAADARKNLQLPYDGSPQLLYNGYLYYRYDTTYIARLKLADKTVTTSFMNSNYNTLFLYNNLIYIAYTTGKYSAYDPNTGAAVTASDITCSTMNVPTDFYDTVYFGSIDYLYQYVDVYGGESGEYYLSINNVNRKKGIVTSSITNVGGTIIGLRPRMDSVQVYLIGGKRVTFLHKVDNDMKYTNITTINGFDNTQRGIKLSNDLEGNLLSFVELTSPITKTNADVLYLSYGYKLA